MSLGFGEQSTRTATCLPPRFREKPPKMTPDSCLRGLRSGCRGLGTGPWRVNGRGHHCFPARGQQGGGDHGQEQTGVRGTLAGGVPGQIPVWRRTLTVSVHDTGTKHAPASRTPVHTVVMETR